MSVVDYKSALAFLLERVNYETFRQLPYNEMRQNLARLSAFLEFLKRPHLRYPVIHVAGTKGKGSTCALLGAVLRESGYRVGCFTSPHLHSLNERFAVNGQPCPNERLVEIVQHLKQQWQAWPDKHLPALDGQPQRELTFFELSVLFAFDYFARERVDVAVVETGLGGRLDATNVCVPMMSVMTSISFDHTEQLGTTLAAIATEKAGIIKHGVPVVCGVVAHKGDDPQTVIRDAAKRNDAALYEIDRDFSIVSHGDGSFDFRLRHKHDNGAPYLKRLRLALMGRHQRHNAALVLACVVLLRQQGWNIPDAAVRAALAGLEMPCRVERLKLPSPLAPTVIIDGAHNKASAEALLETLREIAGTRQTGRKVLLFGSTIGKDVVGMFETLLPFFDELCLSQCTTSPRAVPVADLLIQAQNAMYKPKTVSDKPKTVSCAASPRAVPEADLHRQAQTASDKPKTVSDKPKTVSCAAAPRAVPEADLHRQAQTASDKPKTVSCAASPRAAAEYLRQSTNQNDLVCVTGSLYFAAEMREQMLQHDSDHSH